MPEMKTILLPILLGELCLLVYYASGQPAAGVTFCVKPTKHTNCSLNYECHNARDCQNFEYYWNNINSIINQQQLTNITLYFLNGIHTGNCVDPQQKLSLVVPYMRMIGESEDVQIKCLFVEFQKVIDMKVEKMEMINGQISIKSSLLPQMLTQAQIIFMKTQMVNLDFKFLSHVIIKDSLISTNLLNISGLPITNTSHLLSGCTLYNGTFDLWSIANMTVENCNLTSYKILSINSSVLFTGVSQLAASNNSAILSVLSTIVLSGNVFFINNRAPKGGAIALYSSHLKLVGGTSVSFINNTAFVVGGAIYVDPGYLVQTLFLLKAGMVSECFYQIIACEDTPGVIFHFANNSAANGGGDIYGASLNTNVCQPSEDTTCPIAINGTTSVSSDPTRVCLCNKDSKPQCTQQSANYKVYSGETFTVQAVVVGGDFGPTAGTVYANFLTSINFSLSSLDGQSQAIGNEHCTELNYTLYSNHTQNSVMMYLTTMYTDADNEFGGCSNAYCSYTTPVYFNISLLPCLPGFTVLGEPPKCDCYPALRDNGIQCKIVNGIGYFSWTNNLWMNIKDDGAIYSKYCPFDYCTKSQEQVNLQKNPDTQCTFNRAGPLCGGCKENYSLAIGSSHCIHCPNNNNLSLLIFFAAAGFLLVLFITIFNITVTQGMINGLIFYANIVWTYQSIFFPQEQNINPVLSFLKTFIAWVNLDFGIEACFINGLNAFWKTWLQFIFPFYIWAIAGLIIVVAKYSIRLTQLLGNKAVPVLDTLFLLSYMKLLRVVVAALEVSHLIHTYQNLTSTQHVVWSVDGHYPYFNHPHIILFVAGLATLLFLWLPYTLLLFLMQWLRRLSLPNWITRFHPVYDAYFAPLKHKHQYWFGVLLLARAVLLMAFVSTFAIPQYISLLLLLVVGVLLTLYTAIMQPYNRTAILINESSLFANLSILAGFVLVSSLSDQPILQTIGTGLSAGIAFLQFCGIMLSALFRILCGRCKRDGCYNYNSRGELSIVTDFIDTYRHDPVIINDEAQPLLNDMASYHKPTY